MVVGVARCPWSVIGDRLSVIGMLECVRRSDSSAQVLRNSRPDFRLLALAYRNSARRLFRGRLRVVP